MAVLHARLVAIARMCNSQLAVDLGRGFPQDLLAHHHALGRLLDPGLRTIELVATDEGGAQTSSQVTVYVSDGKIYLPLILR